MNTIDLKDTNTLTIIFIVVIIIFAIIYLWTSKKTINEGFAQYNINSGDLVSLYGLDNIIVGSDNPISLTSSISNLIDNRTESEYAKHSDLTTTNLNLSSNASSLLTTITSMNNLRDKLNTDLDFMRNIISSNVSTINNNLSTTISTINNNLNSVPPPLTVVAYYGSVAPTGWQLCDGLPLIALDNNPVYYTIGSSQKQLNTPNLLGRFILGATKNVSSETQISSDISLRNNVGITGGEEYHKLLLTEIPAHSHRVLPNPNNSQWTGWSFQKWGLLGSADNSSVNDWPETSHTGGDASLPKVNNINDTKSHNNMPPYYTLIYVIKKPIVGGFSNPVVQPSLTVTS